MNMDQQIDLDLKDIMNLNDNADSINKMIKGADLINFEKIDFEFDDEELEEVVDEGYEFLEKSDELRHSK